MAKIITDNIAYAKVIKTMGESQHRVAPSLQADFVNRIPH
jgi:hypothetical protein